ncbi:hypothetical protein BDZ45DRAFT_688202 [Acephala macrosclerotiorum]|nr:hypothetical protein BDZ45DRAFT_688202 [Acephala macrosclerotiorum]
MSPLLLAGGHIAWWLLCRLIIDCVILSPFLVLYVHCQSRQQNVTKRQWFRDQGIRWLGKGTMDRILPERNNRRKVYMVQYRNHSNTGWIPDSVNLRDNDERLEVVKAGPTQTEKSGKILAEGTACEGRMGRPVPNDSSSTASAEQTTVLDAQEHPVRISGETPAIKTVEKDNTVDRTRDERNSTESEHGSDKTRPGPPPNATENSQASFRDTCKEPETLQEALDALDAEDAEPGIAVEKGVFEPENDTGKKEQSSDAKQDLNTNTDLDEKPVADTTSDEQATDAIEQEQDSKPHADADPDEDAVYDAENEQDPNSYYEESTKDFLARISREHNLELDLKTKFASPKKEKFDVQADFDNAPPYNGDSREAIERRNKLFANAGLKVKQEKKVKEVKNELGDNEWRGQNLEETDSEDDGDEEDWEDVDSGAGSRWNGTGRTWSEIRKEVVSGIRWWSNGGLSSMGI